MTAEQIALYLYAAGAVMAYCLWHDMTERRPGRSITIAAFVRGTVIAGWPILLPILLAVAFHQRRRGA